MSIPWKGAARPLTSGAIATAARQIGCEPDALKAVVQVEAAGRWFEPDGSLPRRFEPHKLPKHIRDQIKWSGGWQTAAGLSSTARRALFDAVYEIDPEAAMQATSWGGPQIMGFNAGTVGYRTARDMVAAFGDDAQAQLDAMVDFMQASGLMPALRAQDWQAVERVYNGGGQGGAYARKMESAYKRLSGRSAPEVLRIGSRGASVEELQRALGMEPDGVFGPDTLQAVRSYQADEGLAVDGMVGAKTWAALREAPRGVTPGPERQEDSFDKTLDRAQKVGVAAGPLLGALSGLLDGLPPMAASILMGCAGAALVIAAGAWAVSRLRSKEATA